MLHGDLWSGNIGAVLEADGVTSRPVIFDPATYFGHHEAEFGMSWCGGEWDIGGGRRWGGDPWGIGTWKRGWEGD